MISALLIDLDGTIYSQGKVYPGVYYAIDYLRRRNIPFRYITNTTGRNRQQLAVLLASLGIHCTVEDIVFAPQAAARYCKKKGYQRIWLATRNDALDSEFNGMELTRHEPQAVVLGDLGKYFTYARMNGLFGALLEGAELIAMQKGRYWHTEEYGPTLDLGPYVTALEYATATEATVVGKPAKAFFELALDGWDFPKSTIAVVGDSIENDLQGASGAGLKSIMVRTGVYDKKLAAKTKQKAGWTIDSIADLPALLDRLEE